MAKIVLITNKTKKEIPLNLIVLKSYLDQTKHKAIIFDRAVEDEFLGGLEKIIEQNKPDFVGISTGSLTYKEDIFLIDHIKKKYNIKSIVGGIFASTPGVFDNIVDYIIHGKGEEKLLKILDDFDGISSQRPSTKINVASIDLRKYDYPKDMKGNKEFPLFTSLGCKYNCLYCSIPKFNDGKVFFKDPFIVCEEIEDLKEKGINHIRFIDDMFGFNKEYTNQLLTLLKKQNSIKGASCQMRIDKCEERFLDELRMANFSGLWFGIESSNEHTLKKIGKHYSTDEVKKVIKCALNKGFYISCSFTIGYPWETEKDIKNTLDFAMELKLSFNIKPNVYIVTPFYGSPLFNIIDKKKIKTWDYSKWDAYHAVMDTDNLPAEKIQDIYDSYNQKILFK